MISTFTHLGAGFALLIFLGSVGSDIASRQMAVLLLYTSPLFGALWATLLLRWSRRPCIDLGCCQACGYNLTGNTSGICPECGTPCKPLEGIAREDSEE